MAQPNPEAIHAACRAAAKSPCQKSQRGAVVFHPFAGIVCPASWNSRPDNLCDRRCQPDKSEIIIEQATAQRSPSRCAMMCLHAEQRAIRLALDMSTRSTFVAGGDFSFDIHECELVHAKVVDGQLVTSGGPSCWQCAKEIADVGLFGVWLYEKVEVATGEPLRPMTLEDRWVFYTARKFYEKTMEACRLV